MIVSSGSVYHVRFTQTWAEIQCRLCEEWIGFDPHDATHDEFIADFLGEHKHAEAMS